MATNIKNHLNILQWNTQSAVAKKPQLEYLLENFNKHVACLSETVILISHTAGLILKISI